ncbi:hypothetical protein D3C81_1345660 [compost metagenome]
MARGIVFFGSFASPAAKPIISKPPNANMMNGSAISSPPKPFGRKPPCDHRLVTEAPIGWIGPKSSQLPNPIIATIASTFTNANQNSTSP